MDPLSIPASVAGLTSICITIVKKLGDVVSKFKSASLVVKSLQSEAKIISVSLSQLQSILLDDADAVPSQALLQPEVLSSVDTALTGCSITLSCLEDEIRSLVAKLALDEELGFVDRAEVVLKDDKFKELSQQLRGQYSALSILLHGLQMQVTSPSPLRSQGLTSRCTGNRSPRFAAC
jgi:cell division control protein 24